MEETNQQSQSPQPINSTPPVVNSGKSKVIPIILGFATVIIIAIGAYLLGTKQSQPVVQNSVQPTPSPSPIPTIDETANPDSIGVNWKTYTNTKSGYLFKYPTDWAVTATDYLNSVQITNKSQTVSITISEGQYPYGFAGESKVETKDLNINVGGKEYLAKETITDNSKAYIDLELDSLKKHHILFGTGYPAGADNKASIGDFNDLKGTILTILSTFKFTN